MIRVVLIGSTILAAQAAAAQPGDEAKAPAKAAASANLEPGEALAKYNGMRDKTPETAAAQWKLALWCEQHGLKAEAVAHLSTVVRLDPKREAAWHKLGYKKHEGQWLTDEQIAEDKEQKKAEKVWAPLLKRVHKDIHGANGVKKQDEAQAALDAISDPQAVPSVYREFCGGGEADQSIAVQIFGRTDNPITSKVLAVIAVYGKTPEVRRQAAETLRRRSPDDFLGLLVGLMSDPLKYEVKAVGGPGSPGVLFVEGEKFNVRRFYAPPPPPNLAPRPGDTVTYDGFGMPVITRPLSLVGKKVGVPGSKSLAYETDPAIQFSATDNMIAAVRGALNAQAQLERDVAQVEAINADITKFNDLVMTVARNATGKDLGRTPKEWRDTVGGEKQYAKLPSRSPAKPTFNQVVPLELTPVFAKPTFMTRVVVDS